MGREIITNLWGRRIGLDVFGDLILNKSDGTQAIVVTSADGALYSGSSTFGTDGDSLGSAHEQAPFTAAATTGAQTNNRDSNSFLYWLNVVLGAGSVNANACAAVNGTTWSEAIGTQMRNLLSVYPPPKYLFAIGPGTNDIYRNASPQSAAQLIPTALEVFQAHIQRGTMPIVLTIPPRDSALSSANFAAQTWTQAKQAEHLKFNDWIRGLPKLFPGKILMYDVWSNMVDPRSANYDAKATTTDDGLHPATWYVADYVTRVLAPALQPYLLDKKGGLYSMTRQETVALTPASLQLVDNPTLFSATGGAVVATGGNSVTNNGIASGLTIFASGTAMAIVASVEAAPGNAPGNCQKVVMQATADGDSCQIISAPLAGRIFAGDGFYGGDMLLLSNCQKLRQAYLQTKVTWTVPGAGSLATTCGTTHNNNFTNLDAAFAGKDILLPLLTPYMTIPLGLSAAGATISSITQSGTTATLTTATAHGLATGQAVIVSGATPAAFNGTFIITNTGANTFTYVMASAPGGDASVVGTYIASGISAIDHRVFIEFYAGGSGTGRLFQRTMYRNRVPW